MSQHDFEYKPLENVVKGLESTEGMSREEIRADLISKGYDPDAFAARMAAKAKALSAEVRLAWMNQGAEVQSRLDAAVESITSWVNRSAAEINQAFDEVLSGTRGSQAQLKLRTAFRNVTELTVQSKAAFLDEVELLQKLDRILHLEYERQSTSQLRECGLPRSRFDRRAADPGPSRDRH